MITATIPASEFVNLDYVSARKLLLPAYDYIHLVLVGCGGTGSWLAPSVARVGKLLFEQFGKDVGIYFVDPDRVELKNVYRQNFCQAEVGRFKAETLAYRYGLAWGIEIAALCHRLKEVGDEARGGDLRVYIGCVDNAEARKEILSELEGSWRAWWLDCGNFHGAGQVLLGQRKGNRRDDPFALPGYCSWLPLPSEQHGELVEVSDQLSAIGETTEEMSCAEMAMRDSQGLAINQRMAAEATDYLVRMLLTKDLQKMATYIDLASGATRSTYITPENVRGKEGG